jgi:hypothetical protein
MRRALTVTGFTGIHGGLRRFVRGLADFIAKAAIEKRSIADNAAQSAIAIAIAIGTSAATGISDSFSNTPLALREADKELRK